MNIISRIKNYLISRDQVTRDLIRQRSRRIERELQFFVRSERLKDYIYKCKDLGVSDEKYCEQEVIVSLTTHGKRLYDAATTIESVMQGSMRPNRIVLWLGEELKDEELPISLQLQQKRGLQIEYCKDIRSYTKLVPALRKYPNEIIITIDDDLVYEPDLIENLFRTYKANPSCICANRMHEIVLGEDGKPVEYLKWKLNAYSKSVSPLNFLTGAGGVLYPPHSLDEEVFNEEVFLNICKYADDIWFFAMAKKKGTDIIKSFTHSSRGEDYVENLNVQDVGLKLVNYDGEHLNDIQFEKVFTFYDLYSLLDK